MEPVIRQLASRHRRVIVHSRYNELFRNYPLPNVVFRDNLGFFEKVLIRLDRYLGHHFSIDLDGSYEAAPRQPILHAYQNKAGLPLTREYPRLYLSEEEKTAFPNITAPPDIAGKYVVLHLESFSDKNYRKVYGIDWDVVAATLHSLGYAVVSIGKTPPVIKGVSYRPTTIREMIRLIAHSAFFIGLDSGPSHLAAALNVPSLIFFGAVNPDYRHFRELLKGRILQQYCEFAGCYHEGASGTEPVCRLVGDAGIPKCSLHTTGYVLNNIDLLLKEYPA